MLALLPPSPSDALWLLPTIVLVGAFWWVVFRRKRQRKSTIIAEAIVLGIGIFIVGSHYLFPPTAQVHREYYQGKSQFEWAAQLQTGDTAAKSEAVAALCEILKSPEATVRWWVVQQLGASGSDARAALPALRELTDTDDEDGVLRENVAYAIEQIDAPTR